MWDEVIGVESSYRENCLGDTLRSAVLNFRPKRIVEFGGYQGYSTIHMAQALRYMGRGHIIACDLWHKYPYRHTTMDVAQRNIERYNVEDYVTLWNADFDTWLENPCAFDMLHLDISNNGDIIEKMLDGLRNHINNGAVIIFEGGSEERDKIEWMLKFNKRPINPLRGKFRILDERFPSISIATP